MRHHRHPKLTRRAILAAAFPLAAHAANRSITDMAGRRVALPPTIGRVVTLGSLPVLNSFVFAMGEAATLVNGLADFDRPHWKYQHVFAPQLARQPAMQLPTREPNLEAILRAAPDVVLTMHRDSVDLLARSGIPTIFLAWREPDDVKTCMTVLGQVFGKPDHAARYNTFFDTTIARIATRLESAPRPRVLYLRPATLSQPRLIAEWWITAAGATSITNDGRRSETRNFTLEQLVLWDPDILIVSEPAGVATLQADKVMRRLRATRAGNIHVAPVGAHSWANRTVEQPLTVLWAAQTFHPTRLANLNLASETDNFYRSFFNHALQPAQIAEILSGTL